MDWMIRKAATPASTTRMTMPAPLASPAKIRSPGCWTGLLSAGVSDGETVGALTASSLETDGDAPAGAGRSSP